MTVKAMTVTWLMPHVNHNIFWDYPGYIQSQKRAGFDTIFNHMTSTQGLKRKLIIISSLLTSLNWFRTNSCLELAYNNLNDTN